MESPSDLLSNQLQDLSLVNNHHSSSSSQNTTKSQKNNEPVTPWTQEEKMAILIDISQRHKEEFMENQGLRRLHRHNKHCKRNCCRAQLLKAKEVLFKLESKYVTHKRLHQATKHLPPRPGNDQTRERRRDHRPNPDLKTWWAQHDKERDLVYGEKYRSLVQSMKNQSKKMDTHLASAGLLSKFEDLSLSSSAASSTT